MCDIYSKERSVCKYKKSVKTLYALRQMLCVFLVLVSKKKKAALHTSELLDNHYKDFSFLCSTGTHLKVILCTQVASSFLKVPR